jgi:hypothetical protein
MGGGSTSESKSGSAQEWAKPYAMAGAGSVQGVYNQNQPGIQSIANGIMGLQPGLLDRFNQGSPNVFAAQNYNNDVLGGKYLNGNPYLQGLLNQTNRDVTNTVDSQFAQAGRYGSGAFVDVLSRNLAEADNNARLADYSAQQARMDNAAQMAPGLAQANYVGLPEILQAGAAGAAIPFAGTTAYANALGALFNGGTQKTTQSNGIGGILQGIGSIGSAIGSMGQANMFSDSRLKSEVTKVDELADGLGVYEWRYVPWGATHRGVMADEVETLRPWAFGPEVNGYKTVNYDKLEAA